MCYFLTQQRDVMSMSSTHPNKHDLWIWGTAVLDILHEAWIAAKCNI